MSGHSHFKSIKYKKAISDLQRAKVFSKLAREITIAARSGSEDPEMNPKLRVAIEKAKKAKMPLENIERAIKRGKGSEKGEKLEEVLFEAYGPGGIAIIIEGITDNKNRALGEVRQVLNQFGGKLVETGSVQWLFEKKGCITIDLKFQPQEIKSKEEIELKLIEAGAEDFYWHNNSLDVYTKISDLEKVRENLENKDFKIESTSLDWVAKEEVEIGEEDRKKNQELFEALDELETVQEIYSNLKP